MLKLYSVIQKGEYHLNQCEDHLFSGEIGKNIQVCAVMDGCTNGKESHFASVLIGKLLSKIVRERGYFEFYQSDTPLKHPEMYLKLLLQDVFRELYAMQRQLMLDTTELLSTLILMVINKVEQRGALIVIGDGVVYCNRKIVDFEQDNKPDYLAFHLKEDFETWYDLQKQRIVFDQTTDVSIATDGITSFTKISRPEIMETIDPAVYLLSDETYSDQEDMLDKKLKYLEYNFGLKPTDDLAIIRVIFEKEYRMAN